MPDRNPDAMTFDFYADFLMKAYGTIRSSENIIEGQNEVMVIVHDAFQVSHRSKAREEEADRSRPSRS